MGLFRKRNDDEQIAVLRAEVQAMNEQLDVAERSKAELESQVSALDHRISDRIDRPITATPAPPPPPPLEPPVGPSRIDRIEEQLGEIAATTARLDERVTNVSTELANQLTELSTDIDYVAQGLPTGSGVAPLDPEVIEARLQQRLDEEIDAKLGIELGEVRDSAERLALEQARYEIQFRRDLAELAERFRRPGAD
jgi:methyl-accepting chemotaxis protein